VRKDKQNYAVFLVVIAAILFTIIGFNKCKASPCMPYIYVENGQEQTRFLDDWGLSYTQDLDACMSKATIITRGDINNPIEAAIISRADFQLIMTIWAGIFFPGLALAILKAIT
jgi:hypothetical protein